MRGTSVKPCYLFITSVYVKFGLILGQRPHMKRFFIGLLREIGHCYGECVVIFLKKFILYNVHFIINPDPVTETTTKVGQHSVTI